MIDRNNPAIADSGGTSSGFTPKGIKYINKVKNPAIAKFTKIKQTVPLNTPRARSCNIRISDFVSPLGLNGQRCPSTINRAKCANNQPSVKYAGNITNAWRMMLLPSTYSNVINTQIIFTTNGTIAIFAK